MTLKETKVIHSIRTFVLCSILAANANSPSKTAILIHWSVFLMLHVASNWHIIVCTFHTFFVQIKACFSVNTAGSFAYWLHRKGGQESKLNERRRQRVAAGRKRGRSEARKGGRDGGRASSGRQNPVIIACVGWHIWIYFTACSWSQATHLKPHITAYEKKTFLFAMFLNRFQQPKANPPLVDAAGRMLYLSP